MTDVLTLETTAGVLATLASDRRPLFLAQLAAGLTVGARDGYPETGIAPERSLRLLRCHNELLIVVCVQLEVSLGGRGPGYPDPAFVEVLTEKARMGGCEFSLQWALDRAIQAVASPASSDGAPPTPPTHTGTGSAGEQTASEFLPPAVLERVVAYLGSDRRLIFLCELGDEITLAGRSLYLGDVDDEARAVRGLRRLNELQIVIIEQVRRLLADGTLHPSAEALVNQLVETAQQVGLKPASLSYMMERALMGIAAAVDTGHPPENSADRMA